MLLIEIALIVLIASVIWEKKRTKIINLYKSIEKWLDVIFPPVFINTGHASREAEENQMKAENKLSFLRAVRDYCMAEGLTCKVGEDFKDDAMYVIVYDTEKNIAWRTLVKRKDYEEDPIACVDDIKMTYKAALEKSYKEETNGRC